MPTCAGGVVLAGLCGLPVGGVGEAGQVCGHAHGGWMETGGSGARTSEATLSSRRRATGAAARDQALAGMSWHWPGRAAMTGRWRGGGDGRDQDQAD